MTNVLLIAVDTLRADHLGCYGYSRLTSPHLDRIAAEGVVFEDHFATHIPTHPGFTTIFTGLDAFTHQRVRLGGDVLPDPRLKTLAQLLAEAGYQTAAVDNLPEWFRRGFELYETYKWPWAMAPGEAWRRAEVVNERALPLLDQLAQRAAAGRPFFLFLHYWDPHTPYLTPPPFRRRFYGGNEKDPRHLDGPHSMKGPFEFEVFNEYFKAWIEPQVTDSRFVAAEYDALIAYVDVALQHVWQRLAHHGLDETTLVVITSDHGEVLDDHPCWFDHHGLYDANVRVPFILRQPGRLPAGRRVSGFVRHQDQAPTILDHLGLGAIATRERMDGASALPLVHGRGRAARAGLTESVYLTENTWMRKRGWRTREWKLIDGMEPDIHHFPLLELYHLPSDPAEQHNLAPERPEVVASLQADMLSWLARRVRETGKPDPMSYQRFVNRRIAGPRRDEARQYVAGQAATRTGQ
ncbi:MAG TPA: sulfatase [Chloroflexota bacterium]|nr:sulfatase [Chloroflexota bacterium]